MATREQIRRYLQNRQDEVDSATQYRAMAESETDAAIAEVYRDLAVVEERHAKFWEARLVDAGHTLEPRRASFRARLMSFVARRMGAHVVLPSKMSAEKQKHTRVLGTLASRRAGTSGSALARVEGRHRVLAGGGNALRAAVLGANDGLCSNLALVMGMAGASSNPRVLLLTGLAGLLAGACSMALGEWVSVTSARELAERQIGQEEEELDIAPDDEREEIELIYRAKGVERKQAAELARQLMADPKQALDVLAREELGIDPDDLGGSPYVAAFTSFLLFAVGAIVPVAPLFFTQGTSALVASLALSGVALAAIGAAITVFTGKPMFASAVRQLVLGLAAAGATYGIGRLFGVALGG